MPDTKVRRLIYPIFLEFASLPSASWPLDRDYGHTQVRPSETDSRRCWPPCHCQWHLPMASGHWIQALSVLGEPPTLSRWLRAENYVVAVAGGPTTRWWRSMSRNSMPCFILGRFLNWQDPKRWRSAELSWMYFAEQKIYKGLRYLRMSGIFCFLYEKDRWKARVKWTGQKTLFCDWLSPWTSRSTLVSHHFRFSGPLWPCQLWRREISGWKKAWELVIQYLWPFLFHLKLPHPDQDPGHTLSYRKLCFVTGCHLGHRDLRWYLTISDSLVHCDPASCDEEKSVGGKRHGSWYIYVVSFSIKSQESPTTPILLLHPFSQETKPCCHLRAPQRPEGRCASGRRTLPVRCGCHWTYRVYRYQYQSIFLCIRNVFRP